MTDGLQHSRVHLYAPSSDTLRSLDETLGATHLTWSPDSAGIVYAADRATKPGDDTHGQVLRIIDVETGRQDVMTGAFRVTHGIGPVWSPDGETIVYQRAIGSERHEVVMVTPGDRSADTGLPREVVISPRRHWTRTVPVARQLVTRRHVPPVSGVELPERLLPCGDRRSDVVGRRSDRSGRAFRPPDRCGRHRPVRRIP
jgi:Tol biopolymer transport system component